MCSRNSRSFCLTPGTYRITGWVDRPLLPTGGQWFWDTTDSGNPVGSEYYIQNPGGGLLPSATSPTPGSTVFGLPPDLAFTIFGQAVPEPSGSVLLAAVGLAVSIVGRRRRHPSVRSVAATLIPHPRG